MNTDTIVTDTIMPQGIEYKTCDQLETYTSIRGEQAIFPCGGYVLDILPNITDPEEFKV